MKSAVVFAKFHTESDFIDADGQPIILSQLYRSEDSGDRYSINESPYEWKGKLYLRNVDKWDSHIDIYGCHALCLTNTTLTKSSLTVLNCIEKKDKIV